MDGRGKIFRQGLLKTRQDERDALETKLDRCVKDLEYYAYPYDGIKSIEADKVLQAAGELKALKTQWLDLGDEIRKLESEL